MSKSSIVHLIAQAPIERRVEAKRRMAAFAEERALCHQGRADYWYRIQAECQEEAAAIESGTTPEVTQP